VGLVVSAIVAASLSENLLVLFVIGGPPSGGTAINCLDFFATAVAMAFADFGGEEKIRLFGCCFGVLEAESLTAFNLLPDIFFSCEKIDFIPLLK
jgi:hypothetical protein